MPHHALIEKLHAEIVVQCQVGTCGDVFVPTEPPQEPVELWAIRAATEAETLGWSISTRSFVTCPKHGGRSYKLPNLLLQRTATPPAER